MCCRDVRGFAPSAKSFYSLILKENVMNQVTQSYSPVQNFAVSYIILLGNLYIMHIVSKFQHEHLLIAWIVIIPTGISTMLIFGNCLAKIQNNEVKYPCLTKSLLAIYCFLYVITENSWHSVYTCGASPLL